MTKIDVVYLRRFLDPVNEAGQAHKEATAAMLNVAQLQEKQRNRVLSAFAEAEKNYHQVLGELVGGLNELIRSAEAEESATLVTDSPMQWAAQQK